MIPRYAVMGNPIAHSLSPMIHQLFATQTGRKLSYEKIEIDLSRFEQQVHDFFNQGGKGLNITLPCKQRAFAMAEHQSARCQQAKAANTLWMKAGKLHADNTDGIGLCRDLARRVNLAGKTILLLGAGGAASGILGPLLASNLARLTIANRTFETAQALQQDFPQATCCPLADVASLSYDVIINATSASLNGQCIQLPEVLLSKQPLCYDLAYHKNGITPFVAWARTLGCVAIDGLGMLVEQAAEAFFIWHGVMPDTAPVFTLLNLSVANYEKNA